MGRECRRVPPDWEHPRNERGEYKPLHDEPFRAATDRWKLALRKWEEGYDEAFGGEEDWRPREPVTAGQEYWEWAGGPPEREYYRPDWPDESRTHFQMYEDTTEGTPISPVFATPEEVARWCADNGASASGCMTASYEAWLRVAKGGWAPTLIVTSEHGMMDGVTGARVLDETREER